MIENNSRIKLNYTLQEWIILTKIANMPRKQDFRIFITTEMKQLAQLIDANKICLDCNAKNERKVNNFLIPYEAMREIECLSLKMGVGASTIVQRFITDKLLAQYYHDNKFLIF